MKQAIGMITETWWSVEPPAGVKCRWKTGIIPVKHPTVSLEEDHKPSVVFDLFWTQVLMSLLSQIGLILKALWLQMSVDLLPRLVNLKLLQEC